MCNSRAKAAIGMKRSMRKKKKHCPRDEQREEPRLSKCRKRKRASKPKKCLTEIEKIMLKFQPPMADRERYINPHHVNCFLEGRGELTSKKVNNTLGQLRAPKPKHEPCKSAKRKKKKKERGKDEEAKTGEGKVEGVVQEGENTNKGKEKRVHNDDEEEDKNVGDEEDKKLDRKTGKNKTERNEKDGAVDGVKKKKKKKKRKLKPVDADENTNSEISVCSVDSRICLEDLGLTREDRKKIEENRKRVRSQPEIKNTEKKKNGNENEVTKKRE